MVDVIAATAGRVVGLGTAVIDQEKIPPTCSVVVGSTGLAPDRDTDDLARPQILVSI